MVFHLLPAAVAEFVSQFRLFDGLDDPLMFVVVLPRPGILNLIERIDLQKPRHGSSDSTVAELILALRNTSGPAKRAGSTSA
jgi:hypothetical protein